MHMVIIFFYIFVYNIDIDTSMYIVIVAELVCINDLLNMLTVSCVNIVTVCIGTSD